MSMENNEKVLSIYRAVWDLIEEGADIHQMKVADITARAGVGKGTAYEYFRSKEELLQKSLQYEVQVQFKNLENTVEKQKTFRAAVQCCFDWMEAGTEKRRMTLHFFRTAIAHIESEIEEPMGCVKNPMSGGGLFEEVLQRLTALGREEGMISGEMEDDLIHLQLVSGCLGYFAYLEMGEKKGCGDRERAGNFLYESIVKGLN